MTEAIIMIHRASRWRPTASSAERDPAIARLERLIAPHVDAAFNLVIWLIGSRSEAEDIVLRACLRAFHEPDEMREEQALVRLLALVHAACYRWLSDNRANDQLLRHELGPAQLPCRAPVHRPAPWQENLEQQRLATAVIALPVEEREVLVLHEIELLTCREIAAITNTPVSLTRSRLLSAVARLGVTMCPMLSPLPVAIS